MKSASEIADLIRDHRPDDPDSECLISTMRQLRADRNPFHLCYADLDRIFCWKLGKQYWRHLKIREGVPDEKYCAVTRAAFEVELPDNIDREVAIRMGLLTQLPGVGSAIASAILALVEPNKYGVIDFRGWRQVMDFEKRQFTIRQYIRYRSIISEAAEILGWSVQETDLAIWQVDLENNP